MFKIDWPCAIGGAFLGYYAKGKVESVKGTFRGIYTDAVRNLKESFEEDDSNSQPTQAKPTQGNGNGNG